MSTHIQICKPGTGWEWLVKGLVSFKQRPGEMFFLGNTYLFVVLFPSVLIPILGAVIVTIITPGLGAGVMIAGKMASLNMKTSPKVLFTGFFAENKRYAQRLLILGAAYAICFAIIKLAAHLVMGEAPAVSEEGFDINDPQTNAALAEFVILNTMFMAVASVPVILAFWFAPALIIWHDMPAPKALFASWIAVWRNKTAFLVYGTGWLILVIGAVSVLSFIFEILALGPAIQGALHLMTASLVMAVSICTVYPTYKSILETDQNGHLKLIV